MNTAIFTILSRFLLTSSNVGAYSLSTNDITAGIFASVLICWNLINLQILKHVEEKSSANLDSYSIQKLKYLSSSRSTFEIKDKPLFQIFDSNFFSNTKKKDRI